MLRAQDWHECALCQSEIAKGQYYYRDDPHPMARYHRGQTARQICVHCIKGDVYLEEQRATGQCDLDFGEQLSQPARVEWVDVTDVLLKRLRLDPDEIYRITHEQFEKFVCGRLSAMKFETRLTGRADHKDGGIDILFWNEGPFPIIGAAQVKHHRAPNRPTGSGVIRDFRGALAAHPVQFGVVITNTTFTVDARWFADHHQGLLRLRDGQDLRKWINDKFVAGELWRPVPTEIQLCPGVVLEVPLLR
jgi:hypothetical protein